MLRQLCYVMLGLLLLSGYTVKKSNATTISIWGREYRSLRDMRVFHEGV